MDRDAWIFVVLLAIGGVSLFRIINKRSQREQSASNSAGSSRNTSTGTMEELLNSVRGSSANTPAAAQPAPRSTAPATSSSSRPVRGEGPGPIYYFANGSGSLDERTFCFSYEKINGSWRAYIEKMPPLKSRDSSFVVTHRLRATDGRTYVCWDSPIKSLHEMETVSKMWADCICEYIATGKRFG